MTSYVTPAEHIGSPWHEARCITCARIVYTGHERITVQEQAFLHDDEYHAFDGPEFKDEVPDLYGDESAWNEFPKA